MLHVTNGDAAGDQLRRAGLPGEVLPWRDILHEGPVPAEVSDAQLREVRARFISDQGWATAEGVRADLAARDEALDRAAARDEVVLWFEHDLFDQLQLIQILDRLARGEGARSVHLICIDRHPSVERFFGLGQLQPEHFAELFAQREPVTPEQIDLASRAWAAFRSPDPTRIEAVLADDPSALPFLAGALRRHLEQFPGVATGLSRSEREILEVATAGVRRLDRIFQATQDLEEAPFLGDATLWTYVAEMCAGERPLLRTVDGGPIGSPAERAEREREVTITEWGTRVRRHEADWIRLRGGIDRWLGGVHLTGVEPQWRWDVEAGRLLNRAQS